MTVELGAYRASCPADRALLIADDQWRPGARRRAVVVCHSAGQGAADQDRAEWWPVPVVLAGSGDYVCLACDLGDPTRPAGPQSAGFSWGSEAAVSALDDVVALVRDERVGADGGPVLLAATSMGALVALGWARRHPGEVAGILLGCPVLALEDLYRSPTAGLAESVAAAFGVDPGDELPGLDQHDPWRYAADLAGLPIRVYASADDPIASDTETCRRWAARVGGPGVSVVDLGACGHWPRDTPAGDALAFAAGC